MLSGVRLFFAGKTTILQRARGNNSNFSRKRHALNSAVTRMLLSLSLVSGPPVTAGRGSLKFHLIHIRIGNFFAVRAGRLLIRDDMGLGKTIQAPAASEVMAVLRRQCAYRLPLDS